MNAYDNETNPAATFRFDVRMFLMDAEQDALADDVMNWDEDEARRYAEAYDWDAKDCADGQVESAADAIAEQVHERLYSPYTPQADLREAEFEMSRFTDDY